MNAKTTGILTVAALAALAVVLCVFAPSFGIEAVYPVERIRTFAARQVFARLRGAFAGAEAAAENARLRRTCDELRLVRGDAERLRAENARLRRALGYVARAAESWIPAAVLTHGGGAAGQPGTFRVACGALDGVRAGAVVAVAEGLVGRVASVTPHTATVATLNDPSVKVACSVRAHGETVAHGILSGGDELLLLKYLRGLDDLPAEARVEASGAGGVFPRGLAVGTLRTVAFDPRGLVREGRVRPCVDYTALEDVFIRREE